MRGVNAMQNQKRGTISLSGKAGITKLYNMGSKKLIEEFEDEDESSEEDSSTVSEVDSDSTSSEDEDVDVAFLLVDEMPSESSVFAMEKDMAIESYGPYEVIEELMQPKLEREKKQELMAKMICADLSVVEKEKYMCMLARFPDLFITSYEEI